jgi:TP901 family phage tail tape measure protein
MAFSLKGILSLDNTGFVRSVKDSTSAVDGMKGSTDNAGTSLKNMVIAGAGIAGITFGVKAAFDTFVTFEKKMSNVKALIGGVSDNEMTQLNDKAKEMGRIMPAKASEAADAMANLASAGFSTNEVLASVEGTLYLAQAATTDMATAADISSSALRGFGLAASDAGHVADALARTAADTNAGIIDIGEAMKYISPMAHAAGQGIEEMSAAIGVMANSGIKGSQAGTTLRGALVRLTKPPKQAADALDKLKMSVFDGQGNMKHLSDIIGELTAKTSMMTMEQRNAAIGHIFGTEALSGMLSLMQAGKPAIDKLTDSLKNSTGAAKEMALTQTDNVYGALQEIEGTFETFQINMVTKFAPTIKNALLSINNVLPKMANEFSFVLDTLIKNSDQVFLLVDAYAAYKGVMLVTKGVELALMGAIAAKNVVMNAGAAITLGYTAATEAGSVATGVFTAANLLLNDVLMVNPYIAAAVAIIGIGTALVFAYQKCTWFRNEVDYTAQSIRNLINRMEEMLGLMTPLKADMSTVQISKFRENQFTGLGGGDQQSFGSADLSTPIQSVSGGFQFGGADIGGKANGTSYFSGGATAINERGGELQVLPNGTGVIPSERTQQLISNDNSKGGNIFHISIDARGMQVDEMIDTLQLRLANM